MRVALPTLSHYASLGRYGEIIALRELINPALYFKTAIGKLPASVMVFPGIGKKLSVKICSYAFALSP